LIKQPLRILVIDGDKKSRKILEDILRIRGFEPIGVNSGKEAIERLKKEALPLALIDLCLENMLDLNVLQAIKEVSPETECIVMTGRKDREETDHRARTFRPV